jgi:hypothetical protein
MLTVLSTRVGTAAARIGARPFLVVGPLLMGFGLLWYLRVPPTSEPWLAALGQPSTLVPPLDTIVDILPAVLLFGTGISLVVAPLTTTLMGSVPVGNAGIASAINNAISRVGGPCGGDLHRHPAAFYAPSRPACRVRSNSPGPPRRPPLNPPAATVPPGRRSEQGRFTDAFHLASIVGAVLCSSVPASTGSDCGRGRPGRPPSRTRRPRSPERPTTRSQRLGVPTRDPVKRPFSARAEHPPRRLRT